MVDWPAYSMLGVACGFTACIKSAGLPVDAGSEPCFLCDAGTLLLRMAQQPQGAPGGATGLRDGAGSSAGPAAVQQPERAAAAAESLAAGESLAARSGAHRRRR